MLLFAEAVTCGGVEGAEASTEAKELLTVIPERWP